MSSCVLYAHPVCVSSRHKSIVVSCQRKEKKQLESKHEQQRLPPARTNKKQIMIPSPAVNPMLPCSCHAVALRASIHLLPGNSFPSLALDRKISDPQARQHVRAYHGILLVSTHNRLERRHRTGFFRGGWKEGEERQTTEDTQTLTGENLLLCCCGLVVPGRSWWKWSRYK